MNKNDYAFHWRAKLSDGSVIKQFDDDGEHSFKEVQDNEDVLMYFWLELQHSPEPLSIGVNLTDGTFNINDFEINPLLGDVEWREFKPDLRIINFRRVRQNFGIDGEFGNSQIDYFIGWQTIRDGKNFKKLLKIGADGKFGMS